MTNNKSNTVIFTDGASRGNPGSGGWGSIVESNGRVIELGGRENQTTNNRMELTAVIRALQNVEISSGVTVYTDSSYVLKGATQWLAAWQENNWKTKAKQPVLNEDLWKELAEAMEGKDISWKLLPGHSGIPANERCDVIATSFADGKIPKLFNGDKKDYNVDLSVLKATKAKPKSSKSNPGKAYSYVSLVDGKVMTHKTWEECKARVSGVSKAKFKKSLSAEGEREIIEEYKISR